MFYGWISHVVLIEVQNYKAICSKNLSPKLIMLSKTFEEFHKIIHCVYMYVNQYTIKNKK